MRTLLPFLLLSACNPWQECCDTCSCVSNVAPRITITWPTGLDTVPQEDTTRLIAQVSDPDGVQEDLIVIWRLWNPETEEPDELSGRGQREGTAAVWLLPRPLPAGHQRLHAVVLDRMGLGGTHILDIWVEESSPPSSRRPAPPLTQSPIAASPIQNPVDGVTQL